MIGKELHVTFLDESTNIENWYNCRIVKKHKNKNKWIVKWEDGSSSAVVLLTDNFRKHKTNLITDENHATRDHPLWSYRTIMLVRMSGGSYLQQFKITFETRISDIISKINSKISIGLLTSPTGGVISSIDIYKDASFIEKKCTIYRNDQKAISKVISTRDLCDIPGNNQDKGVYIAFGS